MGTQRLETRARRGWGARTAVVLFFALLASCAGRSRWPNFSTQQYPAPMEATVDPLPPGSEQSFPPGPEEVIVGRLADPVQLRPAGEAAAFPLRFFDKRRRANAGAWVFSAAGGRAEILWPSGTSVVLFDRCTAIVGSPSRGDPELILRAIDRVVFNLTPGNQIELLGGARLSADSGPWLVERRLFEILRVKNQSKVPGEIAYRDEVFILAAGETVDLPLLSAGGRPTPATPGTLSVAGDGFEVDVYGGVDVEQADGAVRLLGNGENEISGLGVRLHLGEGERATFTGLDGGVASEGVAPEGAAPEGAAPEGAAPEGAAPDPQPANESPAQPAEQDPAADPAEAEDSEDEPAGSSPSES